MKTVTVRPLGGRKIRVPERPSQILPADGMLVALSDYWQARIETGDVEIVPTKAKPAPRRAAAPKTTSTPPQEE